MSDSSRSDSTPLKNESELKRLIQGQDRPNLSQIEAVIGKLQIVMSDYLESGKPLKITLSPVEILSALDAAIHEANGQPSPWPDGADVRTFFIHGLYDEIIQQPSNIFETRVFPDGSERYIPVSKATWKACLAQLRSRIIESGIALAKKHGAMPPNNK
ncbi:hypothetical protein EI77_01046 [Prosthecobacter fusiformis]|uniref:Uncharacterized protein n=1 Tax=Prosthecobacter fusiformis TaxID=48464 RepID=A0A4R7STB2_9BACT|nr:hypothetical protein [Prosthecobacter fusiformis]TDU81736.1 hypothetical protein EI77_01046 [Prosthecobacter fusiformis]